MNKKIEVYVKKAKKINRTIIALAISIFLLGILISIVYFVINKKQPIDEIQMISTEEETESFTNELGDALLNPGKGYVLRSSLDNSCDDLVSVVYYRFNWCDIEPEEGQYNWEIIDSKIEDCITRGKKFAFGVMNSNISSSKEYITPKWVFDSGADYYIYNNESKGIIQIIPVWTDKVYLEKVNNFVEALGERYDGNQNIAYIDIRSYGSYGEQHLSRIGGNAVSAEELKELYVKPYMNAFQKTLLVNPWGTDSLNDTYKWSIDNGVSIRRDGILKYENGKSIFEYAYGKLPTIFEYYLNWNELKSTGLWNEENLLNYIEEWHPSYIEFFPQMYEEDPDFCEYVANRIGYHFRFKSAIYENVAKTVEETPITLNFINEGVTPLYEPCTVYIGLLDENYNLVKKYKTDIDPHTWLPDEEVEENIDIRLNGVDDGEYIIALGLFYNEKDENPTYLLGNTGKTEERWYVFGRINVTNPEEEYTVNLQDDDLLVNSEQYEISVGISNLRTDKAYDIKIILNNELLQTEAIDNSSPRYNKEFTLKLQEGKNNYKIQIEKDNEIIYEFAKDVYVSIFESDYVTIAERIYEKYNEFIEKYQQQISKILEIQQEIQTLKQNIQNILTDTELTETKATMLIQEHYNLGKNLIDKYKNRNLQVDYEKLYLMLKDIYDIGIDYENLITISAKKQTNSLSNLIEEMTRVEEVINNNQDLEMIYPSELLQISKNIYYIATEINSLEIDSQIKESLLKGKGLHCTLVLNLALKFAELYIDEYITNNPVEITYSTTELTNQPVTATLQTNANITVTNNSNSKTYTFNQNGSFTFEYTIKGQAFQKTATVNNIDKTAPTITGIQNDKLYLDSVAPQIQDDNLKEVTLSKDGNIVGDYQTNATISEDGYYKIVAIDKAGNQTQIEFYISRNPASITYSTTDWTNKNVTATITSSFEVEVINNSNNMMHTFTQNGEFTFQVRIKGTDIELTATVNNIDKTPPVITGVEQGGQYLTKATPVITDDNLQEIKLYLNDALVNNYTSNTELSEEGFYKLIATDKAGNETKLEFTVIENISEEYQLRNQYILNIENHTAQEEFRNNLKLVNNYQILRNGNTLAETDIIATGDILRTNGGEEYTLIVNGDVNKDGEVNIKDMVRLRKYLLERNNLDELELLAADCNLDERPISIKDLVRMRIIVLQRDAT